MYSWRPLRDVQVVDRLVWMVQVALERDARRFGLPGTGNLHTYMWQLQHGNFRLIELLYVSFRFP